MTSHVKEAKSVESTDTSVLFGEVKLFPKQCTCAERKLAKILLVYFDLLRELAKCGVAKAAPCFDSKECAAANSLSLKFQNFVQKLLGFSSK